MGYFLANQEGMFCRLTEFLTVLLLLLSGFVLVITRDTAGDDGAIRSLAIYHVPQPAAKCFDDSIQYCFCHVDDGPFRSDV